VEQGLYESLMTSALEESLTSSESLDVRFGKVDDADAPHVLTRHVASVLHRLLSSTKDPVKRLAIVNGFIQQLESAGDDVTAPPTQLLRVADVLGPGSGAMEDVRPTTPLSEAALPTNAKGEPSLGAELRAELDTADEVDLLCAFVKWYGLRVLEPELKRLRARGTRLRVITTTYMGATERLALDRLVLEFGAEVKIQYDAQRTRLHAKAWLFRRRTQFDTAYVGSSNLSKAALLDGVEWNVRLSRVATPALLEKFRATFDTYWNDATFESYDPDRDRDRLDDALRGAGDTKSTGLPLRLSNLMISPFHYQLAMLEALQAERTVHNRHRNLVLAATGTGKTVVAALDYRNMCENNEERPSLLFVAHRREILQQSLRTYQEVLSDANFGEPWVGDSRPERWRHVFASIQSLHAYGAHRFPTDAFEVVVIDEFHHAEAATYRKLVDHLAPTELLGLTATPERTDGVDVRAFFDGRTAAELRIWDALSQDLLCPFHYFGISDGTDLTQVGWARGRYDETALSDVYTGNDVRSAMVLRHLQDKVLNVHGMRALGFCVSVAHAEYMAQVFNEAGVAARAVSGTTPTHGRERALRDLKDRRVNVLFAADLFNEGLDLPEVDTVLFLRPTESATVFLQQLGRGLRLSSGKPVLTALDFVGHHRKEFRFDTRFRALTGSTRKGLERDIEHGFPFLPSGCQIVLDEQTQKTVLENVRSQLPNRWPKIVAELRSQGDQDLPTFLDEAGLELSDVVRTGRSWTRLRRDAGLPTRTGSGWEDRLLKRIRAFSHVDDRERLDAYSTLLADDSPSYSSLPSMQQRFAQMLFFSLFPDGGGFASYDDGLASLRAESAVRDELRAVVDIAFDKTRHIAPALAGELSDVPLRLHARYQREEAVSALGWATETRRPNSFREGVLWIPERNIDAFFVTLHKSEADYSPTTMYRDYPISPSLFHWESQSTTSVTSTTGQRYVTGGSTVLLFVRESNQNEACTAPYTYLGPVSHVSREGDRPIAITWRLDTDMLASLFAVESIA
jgi:superfamily II DNA or RNA helicase/HKD family nuclease